MLLKASTVFSKMNAFSRQRKPFLFGIDFEIENGFFVSPENAKKNGILFSLNEQRNSSIDFNPYKAVQLSRNPISEYEYSLAFKKVQEHLKLGNSYLVNLTFPTPIAINLELDEIYSKAVAKYKLLYKNEFVVFSPETFVKIIDGRIMSFPMKGTIDANLANAEQVVLNDKKELAEHNTIVDLIRNDLGMVASDIRVDRFRYIDRIETSHKALLQVSSQISGMLQEKYINNIGDLFNSILPAGSISGAPKCKTIQIIQEAEICKRGFYTGVFGYFDGKNLDSGVMIRYIKNETHNKIFHSGGGITINSSCNHEYNELIDKVYVPII